LTGTQRALLVRGHVDGDRATLPAAVATTVAAIAAIAAILMLGRIDMDGFLVRVR